jgi:hypothetical protein
MLTHLTPFVSEVKDNIWQQHMVFLIEMSSRKTARSADTAILHMRVG